MSTSVIASKPRFSKLNIFPQLLKPFIVVPQLLKINYKPRFRGRENQCSKTDVTSLRKLKIFNFEKIGFGAIKRQGNNFLEY
jgi:hypothetical protein